MPTARANIAVTVPKKSTLTTDPKVISRVFEFTEVFARRT
jgi:hypothetical protein